MLLKMTNTKTKWIFSSSILLILTISSILTVFPLNLTNSEKNGEDSNINMDFNVKAPMPSAAIGEDPWWNTNFQWRQLINITNPYDDDFVDDAVYIQINHSKYIESIPAKMQADLDDIRIVENGVVRDYYYTTDYPFGDNAVIWFETNISAHNTDYDTYLYFGNDTIGYDTTHYKNDRFGLAWYTFDEDTVTGIVKDSMGKNNATLYGLGIPSVVYVPGYYDQALDFDDSQTNAYISAPNSIINGLNDFTISFWATEGVNGEYLISGSSGGNHNYMLMRSPTQAGWHFYVWRRNATEIHIYNDLVQTDSLVYSNPSTFPTTVASGGFIIAQEQDALGGGFSSSQAFHGMIDDMRFFNYDLTNRELKWLYNNYELDLILMEEQERAATVTIIVKDVDGRYVPGAEVTLWNGTEILNVQGVGDLIQNTSSSGSVEFTKIPYGKYNITISYTLSSGLNKTVVYNTSKTVGGELDFQGLFYASTIYVDIWTIDFRITDFDGDPLNFGFINITDPSTSKVLETLKLDPNGEATFRWLNRSNYYCEVYYNNSDYFQQYTLLNSTMINRISPKTTYFVNKTNLATGTQYRVVQDTLLRGSSLGNPGNTKVIDATVRLNNMIDNLTEIDIWFIDDVSYDFKERVDYISGETNDTLIYHPGEEETFNVYGLRFDVEGENSSICNGFIEVTLTYAYLQEIRTNISKLNIRVIDDRYFEPVEGVTVRITQNKTYDTGDIVTELKTDDNGTAYGQINSNLPYWYKTEWAFNISLWIVATHYDLYVNTTNKWWAGVTPSTLLPYYNYSINTTYSLILEVDLDFENRQSKLLNKSSESEIMSEITWGQNMTFTVNFSITDDGGLFWYGDNDSNLTFTVKSMQGDVIFTGIMNHPVLTGNGNYSITINSSRFSAGNTGEHYLITIIGRKPAYKPPLSDDIFPIKINPLSTSMKTYNYSSIPNELSTNEVSQYYNATTNLTVRYSDSNTNNPLIAEEITYEWDYSAGNIPIAPDPMNPGYYTFEIDTSNAPIIGKYRIDITASLENHTKIENYGIYINILSRPTNINGSSGLLYVSESFYIFEQHNFTFSYVDTMSMNQISNIDQKSYILQKLDTIGDPIPGTEESGSLSESITGDYILDLDTESRDDGEYSIIITLSELNYDQSVVIISLIINKRDIHFELPAAFSGSKVEIDSGAALEFTLTLTDPDDNSSILGANVYLTIKDNNIIFTDHNDGTYTVKVPKIADAFFLPETFTATLTINKEYYNSESSTITIVVKIAETFGFPTFYLLMIIGAIVAVTASLVIYRTVQLAKIPTFVKKVRKMKKEIKGKKTISESLLYPS
ncbi:hypothetical protein LCGC14_1389210, partial [marine sediment metagenome]